jgi:predicted RNA-binding protein with PIN domain
LVGARGFEPPTPCSQGRCASQTALRPELFNLMNNAQKSQIDGIKSGRCSIHGILQLENDYFIIHCCRVIAAFSSSVRGGAISSIIIDGYNLIGIHHTDLNSERNSLITRLSEYRKLKGHDITVVFDGWKSGGRKDESAVIGGVRVIYSRLGDKADLVIKRTISSIKKEWIVITSDRDIMNHAWAEGSVPVPSPIFESFLLRSGSHMTGDYEPVSDEDDGEDEGKGNLKGNARRPSKKDKALKRVLMKL